MLDHVAGQASGAGERVGVNRAGPAVTQMGRQVQERSEAAGGAGELGRPAGQVGQVAAAGSQPRLEVTLEAKQQFAGRLVEGEQGRPVVAGGDDQGGGQRLQFQSVAVGGRLEDGWGASLAAPHQALGEAVEEPGQQASAAEPGAACQPAQDLGLDGQADGQAGSFDVFGGPSAAVDLEQVAGVAFEVDAEVGPGGLVVAAGHLIEHIPFGAEEGDAAVGGQPAGQGFGGGVVDQPPRQRRDDQVGGFGGAGDGLGPGFFLLAGWGFAGGGFGGGGGLVGDAAQDCGLGDAGQGR